MKTTKETIQDMINSMPESDRKQMEEAIELVKPIVAKIEATTPTTKDHYGDYLKVLSYSPGDSERKKMVIVLLACGANEKGVLWANKLC